MPKAFSHDVFGDVRISKKAGQLANSRKVAGDDTLFKTLGSQPDVSILGNKILAAWNCEQMDSGTFLLALFTLSFCGGCKKGMNMWLWLYKALAA